MIVVDNNGVAAEYSPNVHPTWVPEQYDASIIAGAVPGDPKECVVCSHATNEWTTDQRGNCICLKCFSTVYHPQRTPIQRQSNRAPKVKAPSVCVRKICL